MTKVVLGVLILGATAFALLRSSRVPHGPLSRSTRPALRHPGGWLLAVIVLIYLNQVLFTVYIVRVHHGDTGFISPYLPPGWFDLADLGSLPQWFPAPNLLSWSLFRVSSFLELPFGLLAYLTVCRWLDADVYRRAVRLIWPASAAYTVTFCLIEWSLHNPYTTVEDVVIRLASGIVVPWAVSRFAGDSERRVRSLPDLLVFIVSAGALGYLVLAVYDSALLYNLGHVPADLPGAAIAVAVLAVARLLARRLATRPAGPGMTALIDVLGWFLVVFFVPALAIRYGLIFGQPLLGAVAGLAVVVCAVFLGVGRAANRALLTELTVAVVVGAAAAGAALLAPGRYPEARVLAAAGAFLVAVIAVCAVGDRRLASR